jgi:hypothetical protein
MAMWNNQMVSSGYWTVCELETDLFCYSVDQVDRNV